MPTRLVPPPSKPRALRGLSSVPPATPALALLPFATVAVGLILFFNIVRLAATFYLTTAPAPPHTTPLVAPFTPSPAPLKVALPILPTNLQFGNLQSSHTLIILTDPACVPCQLHLAAWLNPLPPSLHIVVKYLPLNPENQLAGLLLELARRHNLAPLYWHALSEAATTASTSTLTDDQLFEFLEQQGLALIPLQNELKKNSTSLVATLTPDLTAAQAANLTTPPILILDDFLLDGRILKLQHLQLYLQRL